MKDERVRPVFVLSPPPPDSLEAAVEVMLWRRFVATLPSASVVIEGVFESPERQVDADS